LDLLKVGRLNTIVFGVPVDSGRENENKKLRYAPELFIYNRRYRLVGWIRRFIDLLID